jgi:hypothetical protein
MAGILDGIATGGIGAIGLQDIMALDYPAGSAWTVRIGGESALAGIPGGWQGLLLVGCGVIWVIK